MVTINRFRVMSIFLLKSANRHWMVYDLKKHISFSFIDTRQPKSKRLDLSVNLWSLIESFSIAVFIDRTRDVWKKRDRLSLETSFILFHFDKKNLISSFWPWRFFSFADSLFSWILGSCIMCPCRMSVCSSFFSFFFIFFSRWIGSETIL